MKYDTELSELIVFLWPGRGGGGHIFYPVKLSCFAEKKSLSEIPKIHKVKCLFDEQKFQKSNIFLEGSGHQNFMNPFVYGKSFLGKSFSKKLEP